MLDDFQSRIVSERLWKFIEAANGHIEAIDISPGTIEQAISDLRAALGDEFLFACLNPEEKIHFPFEEETNPIKFWLRGGHVEHHVEALLEFASTLRLFKEDPVLSSKLRKLTTDSAWPIVFELSVAARFAYLDKQLVKLVEGAEEVGDFHLLIGTQRYVCECARLLSEKTEKDNVIGRIDEAIGQKFSDCKTPRVFKLWLKAGLERKHIPAYLSALTRADKFFRRDGRIGFRRTEQVDVVVELLTSSSEKTPGDNLSDLRGWDIVGRLSSANASDHDDFARRYRNGETIETSEYGRVFINYGSGNAITDTFDRLDKKLGKKIKQRGLPEGFQGRIIFIEGKFDPRLNTEEVESAIRNRLELSKDTSAAFFLTREGNPQRRFHYSWVGRTKDGMSDQMLAATLQCAQLFELTVDPVTLRPFTRSWEAATERTERLRSHGELSKDN